MMNTTLCFDLAFDHCNIFECIALSCVSRLNYASWQHYRSQKTTLNLCDDELCDAFLLRLKAIYPRLRIVDGLYARKSNRRISNMVVQSLFWKGLQIHNMHVNKNNSNNIPLILKTRTNVHSFEMGQLSYRAYLDLRPHLQYFMLMNYHSLQHLELNFGHIRLASSLNPRTCFRLNLLPLANLKSIRLLFRTLYPDVATSLLQCTPTTLERLELVNTISSFESVTEDWLNRFFFVLRKFKLKHLRIVGLLPNSFSSEPHEVAHVNSLILEMPFVAKLDLGCGPVASMHGDLLSETTVLASMTRCHELICRIGRCDSPSDSCKIMMNHVTGCTSMRTIHTPADRLSNHMLLHILSQAPLDAPCLHVMRSELQHRAHELDQQLQCFNKVLCHVAP